MSATNTPAVGSGEWLRSSSDETLRAYVDGNFPGPYFNAALEELRERDAAKEAAMQRTWILRTFWTSLILGLLGIAATIWTGWRS